MSGVLTGGTRIKFCVHIARIFVDVHKTQGSGFKNRVDAYDCWIACLERIRTQLRLWQSRKKVLKKKWPLLHVAGLVYWQCDQQCLSDNHRICDQYRKARDNGKRVPVKGLCCLTWDDERKDAIVLSQNLKSMIKRVCSDWRPPSKSRQAITITHGASG